MLQMPFVTISPMAVTGGDLFGCRCRYVDEKRYLCSLLDN